MNRSSMTCVIIPEVVYTIPGGLTHMLLESRVGGRVAENVFEDMMAQFFFFSQISYLETQKSKNLNEFQQDKHEVKHTNAYHNPTT